MRGGVAASRVGGLFLTLAVLLMAFVPVETRAGDDPLLVVRNTTLPGDPEVAFSEAELLALPQVTIRTKNDFVDDVTEFTGPLVRDVLARVELGRATVAHMVAANDYAIDVPLEEFQKYDVILALSANGKRLTRRDKGPIWVIYPMDDHPELQDPLYNTRLIWQLVLIELR